jgi:hypothetical protein
VVGLQNGLTPVERNLANSRKSKYVYPLTHQSHFLNSISKKHLQNYKIAYSRPLVSAGDSKETSVEENPLQTRSSVLYCRCLTQFSPNAAQLLLKICLPFNKVSNFHLLLKHIMCLFGMELPYPFPLFWGTICFLGSMFSQNLGQGNTQQITQGFKYK